jgi:hypothetical protein
MENNIQGFLSLDYANSDNADEIDNGIRETIKGIRLSILTMGLGLAKIKEKGLYKNLGCRQMTQYIRKLSNETKMDRSSIFYWLGIGEAFTKYKNELEQIGFCDSDGPTKLPYLERALENNEKQEVFDNIKNMSVRDFIVFAKKQTTISSPAGMGDRPVVSIRGSTVYIDGKLAIILSTKLDRRTLAYFKKLIKVGCEALEAEGVILPVHLRSMRDARLFEPAAERLKTQMRMK